MTYKQWSANKEERVLKLSVNVRSDAESFPAKLTMQICNDRITFITRPDRGAPGDEAALKAVALIETFCQENGVVFEAFGRKSAEDGAQRVTDMISIRVLRK